MTDLIIRFPIFQFIVFTFSRARQIDFWLIFLIALKEIYFEGKGISAHEFTLSKGFFKLRFCSNDANPSLSFKSVFSVRFRLTFKATVFMIKYPSLPLPGFDP